jgi:hypothetical protein
MKTQTRVKAGGPIADPIPTPTPSWPPGPVAAPLPPDLP